MDNLINFLLVPASWPTSGAWEGIIKWFAGVGSMALAIILLTVCIKLLILPLDFWQRSNMRKMNAQQAKIKPELDEIKQKYGNTEIAQQKTAEVYKKNKINPAGSCGAMLAYMIVTFVVFITLFNSLGVISQTKINYEYYQLETTYITVYNQNVTSTEYDTTVFESAEEYAKNVAQNEVAKKYDEIKESFLSIKNIWRADNWSSVFPNADEFISNTRTNFGIMNDNKSQFKGYVTLSTDLSEPYVDLAGNVYGVRNDDGSTGPATLTINISETETKTYNVIYADAEEGKTANELAIARARDQFKTDFAVVTNGINDEYKGQWNGYLVLIALSGIITFLSQFLTNLGTKTKDKKGNDVKTAKPNPVMGIILAGVMILFTFNYTSAFALYIVTSNIVSILINILINNIMNGLENRKEKKNLKTVVADYVIKK